MAKKRGRPFLPSAARLVRINGFHVEKCIADYLKSMRPGDRSAWLRAACRKQYDTLASISQPPQR